MVSFRTATIEPSHILLERLRVYDVARLRSMDKARTVRTSIAARLCFSLAFNTAFSYRNIDFEEGSIEKLVSVLY